MGTGEIPNHGTQTIEQVIAHVRRGQKMLNDTRSTPKAHCYPGLSRLGTGLRDREKERPMPE